MVWMIAVAAVVVALAALAWWRSGKAGPLGNPRRAHEDDAVGRARTEVYGRNMHGYGPGGGP